MFYSIVQTGQSSDSYQYLKNPVWWAGMTTMIAGELLNFVGKYFISILVFYLNLDRRTMY